MLERTRDWIARALLPAFLLSLAVFLVRFANDAQGASCEYFMARRWKGELDQLEIGPDGRVFGLVEYISAHDRIVNGHFTYLAWILLAFLIAYLLLSRERPLVRVSVFAGVLLTAFTAVFLFGSVC